MLAIRLFRVGKKNQPAFKIVVTDKKNASTRGRFVEEVGFYNPLTKQRNLKGDRVKYWMSVGAKPSETVHNMLVSDKIIEGAKIPKNKKSKKEAPTTDVSAKSPVPVGNSAKSPVGDPSESGDSTESAEKEEVPASGTAEPATETQTATTEAPPNETPVIEPTEEKASEEEKTATKEAKKPVAEDKKREKTEEVKPEATEPTEEQKKS